MSTQILWYASRATGAVSLVLFSAVMVLGILTAGRKGSSFLPRAAVLRLHRSLTITSMAFLAIHIVTAISDGYVSLSFLDAILPFRSAWEPMWIGLGTVAVDLMLAVGITSALRRRLSPSAWKAVHLSSYAMWPIAVLHGFGTSGGDGTSPWMIILDIVCIAGVLGALAVRLRPDRHPDSVARQAATTAHPRESIGAGR
ncbi:Ferric reductase like transmembrane component [Nakamurella panacisegetis]|uniref:Ferric reductase like transmembrane component n=1 Tax=Nakamurella panacisegetis TaxID=1090615 RepID=A0A1H0JWE5_9ACTN|nr:ferric reductase-like transmembrane domain-containing protein [Nakamurella panacisegetis]SDO47813.1 Ferric reductase like transmembrane component [Nakamurella panacisegetis]